jgi:hypothetical protein
MIQAEANVRHAVTKNAKTAAKVISFQSLPVLGEEQDFCPCCLCFVAQPACSLRHNQKRKSNHLPSPLVVVVYRRSPATTTIEKQTS